MTQKRRGISIVPSNGLNGQIKTQNEDRVVEKAVIDEEERRVEWSLRPRTLEEYIGQKKAKENLFSLRQAHERLA
jgi:hypothetical protein